MVMTRQQMGIPTTGKGGIPHHHILFYMFCSKICRNIWRNAKKCVILQPKYV